ncbi:flagellar hook capping protein, partial [Gemmiger sp.]|uniref:flagellar hook capping protein n=1 Tax=Gemmiger sp. TaxID=2049027 RepID=UPI003AF878AA
QLMVAQLQNQTIDNSMDTSEMMNQLVQMSVVQMLNSVQTSLDNLTATNTMTYAASLVGKTVTVGSYDEDGNIQETVGTVTASGTYQDTPVIFVDGEMYPLSSIMAVGTLPEISETPNTGEGGDESTDTSTGDTAAQQSQAV